MKFLKEVSEMFNYYHVFEYQEKKYIFDRVFFDCDEITSEQYHILKSNENQEEIQSIDQIGLSRTNAYFRSKKIKFLEEETFSFGYFSFPPSHKCNLCCRYCFADAGENYSDQKKEFKKEDIDQISKFMMYDFLPNADSFKLDLASGGEPLLNQKLIYDCLIQVKDNFEKNNKKLFIWLCTNGTCKELDIVKKLSHLGVQFGVSMDGDEKLQNEMRIYKDGSGTYNDVIDFVKQIQDSPDIKRVSKQLWGLAVITAKTKSLVDIHKHHKNIGFQALQMKPARLSKNNVLSFNNGNISSLMAMISEYIYFLYNGIKMNNFKDIIMIANDNDFIGKLLLRIINQTPTSMRCYAGRAKVSIAANGKIYPCDSFIGNDEFCLGNIWDGVDHNKSKLFFRQGVDNKKTCRDCWIKYVCGGDCYHNSYVNNKKIDEPDIILCKINIHIVKEILVFIHNLQRESPNTYNNLKRILKMRSNL
jgi:uncharacterized protein